MIVITGAAGFIGSNLLKLLNQEKIYDIALVDSFKNRTKERNYANAKFSSLVDRDDFLSWFDENHNETDFVFHLGARTNTAEFDKSIFDKLNLDYTKRVWLLCS